MTSDRPDRYVVISADTHAGVDILGGNKPYLSQQFHEEFDAWAAGFSDAWGAIDVEQADTDDSDIRIGVASFMSPYNWDSARRLQHLEHDGIVAEVVFPNTCSSVLPFVNHRSGGATTAEEYRLRWAGIKAHNRWMVDFCK